MSKKSEFDAVVGVETAETAQTATWKGAFGREYTGRNRLFLLKKNRFQVSGEAR